eukprot:m.47590 g.47590  ORF g.47590 m.47590 type:complete len:101 (-) comp12334_c1_seq2:508-810(-)
MTNVGSTACTQRDSVDELIPTCIFPCLVKFDVADTLLELVSSICIQSNGCKGEACADTASKCVWHVGNVSLKGPGEKLENHVMELLTWLVVGVLRTEQYS